MGELGPEGADGREHQGVEGDREQGAGQDQIAPLGRQQIQLHAETGQDERELADLGEARRDRERRADRVAADQDDGEGGERLAQHDHEHHGHHRQGLAQEDGRIEQHADRDEEQDREGVLERQAVGCRLVAEIALAQHHAGEEGAERERHAEQLGRAKGDPERQRQHGQREQLARARARGLGEQPGHRPAADDQHQRHEQADLAQSQRQGEEQMLLPAAAMRGGTVGAAAEQRPGQRRQQDQGQHHGQILDDQPADGDPAIAAVELAPLLQGPQEHDGAGDRQGKAQHQAGT